MVAGSYFIGLKRAADNHKNEHQTAFLALAGKTIIFSTKNRDFKVKCSKNLDLFLKSLNNMVILPSLMR